MVKGIRTERAVGVGLMALSATCFGAMPIFARLIYSAGTDPAVCCCCALPARPRCCAPGVVRGAPLPRGGTLAGLVLLGGVGYVSQSLTYFTALTMTSAALLGLLLYLYPVVVAVLASFLFHVPLTRTRILSLGLALLGAGLTIGPVGEGSWPGIGLGMASALIYSFYILAATRISRGVHP